MEMAAQTTSTTSAPPRSFGAAKGPNFLDEGFLQV